MPFILKKPLVFFDLEATGFDPNHDKIVEFCFLKVSPDGHEEVFRERVNPGVAIPPEATKIHGITNDDVKNSPLFKDYANQVMEILDNADLAGFHVTRFDIPILTRELRDSGFHFSVEGRCVIDSLKIFHKKEERNLAAAYNFYCGKELSHAHSAEADTKATFEVFLAQMERYKDLPRDLTQLHDYCNQRDPRFVDSEGKFSWRHNQACFNFGKYRSLSLKEVARKDPQYLLWLSEAQGTSDEVISLCRKALSGQFPTKEKGPEDNP